MPTRTAGRVASYAPRQAGGPSHDAATILATARSSRGRSCIIGAMATIHVEQIGTGYQVIKTSEGAVPAETAVCIGPEQLRGTLFNFGCSTVGLANIFKQLETFKDASIQV